jgi:hypothetical protein
MCFPTKSQKNNFNDSEPDRARSTKANGSSKKEATKPLSSETQTTTPVAASTVPASEPVTSDPATSEPVTSEPVTSTQTTTTKMAPKVAIIIYTLYGHIAKSMFSFVSVYYV